ncbi:YciI family protein [Paenibacillus radicis (ex Xue et al. 2023)]|uniref:YciI family protein n=1 Tax=Paenibacillus radicis (ex Xue et al. 2023) TaxID=2972489 RepID=A0ABT1YN86_9BACL|nr:YciI family protein [Paenibacillus radicis (ex Xue et al. 2023)]MCR8634637.1 YciI family protein [Paenibacillus radicis (ex Xue et al. 2023)]
MEQLEFVYIFKPRREDFLQTLTLVEMTAMGAHFDYCNGLQAEGILIMSGACTDGAYGMVVFKADSEEEARRIFDNDPVVIADVVDAELHPYKVLKLQGRD